MYKISVNYNYCYDRRSLADAKAVAIEEAQTWGDDTAYIEIVKGKTVYTSNDSGRTWQKLTRAAA